MASPSTSQDSDQQPQLTFVKHQVSKLDTLAGLAIKYNASVGDIKRANGLLSDSALFARGVILIPTSHLPIGHEIQRICAQVLMGANRDPVLHADSQAHPASAAVARIATTLNVVNGHSYPDDLPISECAWIAMCQCGGCGPMDPNGLCARNLTPVEVELTDRSSDGTYLPPANAGPTRQADAVRRRRNQNDGDAESFSDSANSFGWGYQRHASSKGAGGRGDTVSENGRLATWFSELGKAIGEGVSQTVAKVKEAANQPVLAARAGSTGSSGGFGAVADAMLASRKRATGAGTLGRAPFEGSGSVSVSGRPKQGGKSD